jgi:hypothetical protein
MPAPGAAVPPPPAWISRTVVRSPTVVLELSPNTVVLVLLLVVLVLLVVAEALVVVLKLLVVVEVSLRTVVLVLLTGQ